jgi:hypothetical protein
VFGLRQLVGSIAPNLAEQDVASLAEMISKHSTLQAGAKRSSVEIEPKEVLMVLDRLRQAGSLAPAVKKALDDLFTSTASSDSKLAGSLDLLQKLRAGSAEEAKTLQELAEGALAEAKEIVVRIDNWFDSAMSHAAERFKLHARWITAGAAALMALGLQVDGVAILQKLWSDPAVTAQLVVQGDQVKALYEQFQEIEGAAEPLPEQADLAAKIRSKLLESDVTMFYAFPLEGYGERFERHFLGSLLVALLLSLGAPFWYQMIGKVVGFRSALPGKKEKEKT